VLSLTFAAAACGRAPIAWQEPARLDLGAVSAAAPEWRLAIGAHDRPRAERASAPAFGEAPGRCPHSAVFARERAHQWYAAWWSARADSSAQLVIARTTDDGATWEAPIVADARDAGTRGCDRPRPAIAADSATGFVHVAYFLQPREGGGVWLVHSMDHGATWHPPVALMYGGDPAETSVAASGDSVAAAFTSPNANEGWVDLALSWSAGHLIDLTESAVSGRSVAAHAPRVALRGRALAVAWVTDAGSLPMARAGTLR